MRRPPQSGSSCTRESTCCVPCRLVIHLNKGTVKNAGLGLKFEMISHKLVPKYMKQLELKSDLVSHRRYENKCIVTGQRAFVTYSDLSDEEIEVSTGVKLPVKSIEFIKRKNELRALERHVINIIFNLGGEAAEDSEEINILLRRRSLRMLMEEKAARTRADPRWSEHRRVALRRTVAKSTELRRLASRRAEHKTTKPRQSGESYQLTQVQHVESVTVEQVRHHHHWAEFQQVEQDSQSTNPQDASPQWVNCVLLDPPQDGSVILTPLENVQPQYTQIQEVTEVRVVNKIRIYEEIIEKKDE